MKITYSQISLANLCEWFGITRQALHQHNRRAFQKGIEHELVLKEVIKIRQLHKRMGGRKLFIKIKDFLSEHEIKMGRDSFFSLLSANELLVKKRKRRIYTTNSFHWLRKYPNLIRNYLPSKPNELWVSDITYWKCSCCILYISLITDAYSRMIVGYHVASTLESIETIKALKMSIKSLETDPENLIHHSDRGVQYCSGKYVGLLHTNNMQISMTENGNPLENSIAERVNGILKDEYLLDEEIGSIYQAKKALSKAVELYNYDRPHMSISNQTPSEVHHGKIEFRPERLWKNYYKPSLASNQT